MTLTIYTRENDDKAAAIYGIDNKMEEIVLGSQIIRTDITTKRYLFMVQNAPTGTPYSQFYASV